MMTKKQSISQSHFLLVAAHHIAKLHDNNQPMNPAITAVHDLVPSVDEEVLQALWIAANTAVLNYKLHTQSENDYVR